MRGKNKLRQLAKATRIYRIFPTLAIILLAANTTSTLNKEIFLLATISTLIYSAISIQNAIKDKDYQLPKYSNKIIIAILLISLAISLTNKILLLTLLAWITLGLIYNTTSRKILLADTTILAITHYTLPYLSTLLLLNIDPTTTIKQTTTIFVIFFLLTPIKNLKGIKEDKKRKYKTLATIYPKKGKTITLTLFLLSIILMTASHPLFGTTRIFLILTIPLLILAAMISTYIIQNNTTTALKLNRILSLTFITSLIISQKQLNKPILTLTILLFITFAATSVLHIRSKIK
jgi:4-hydroxybenzoate polyprenyltransferase